MPRSLLPNQQHAHRQAGRSTSNPHVGRSLACCWGGTRSQQLRRHIHHGSHPGRSPFAALASAQPFAAGPEPFLRPAPPLLLQRQVASDIDDFFSPASPLSTLRNLDAVMERQAQQMDPFGSSMWPFGSSIRRELADMEGRLDAAFADMDRAQREMDAELSRGLRHLQEQQPGVRIERREERAPGSYRYFESIQIRSGVPMTSLTPAHAHAPAGLFSPLLFAALVLAGAYAALTAAFARNYDLTTYGQRGKWRLLLLWPLLLPFSRPFWRQFSSALRGEKVRVLDSTDGAESGDDSGSSGSGGSTP